MIFPTFAVVIGTLLAFGDAAPSESLENVKAVLEKALAGKDFPTGFQKKVGGNVRKAAASPDTTYLTSGWIEMSYYDDGSCGSPLATSGYAVDTCFIENGLGYKYQLEGDSCTGAIRQDFSDDSCTTLDTTTELDDSNSCLAAGGNSMRTFCTSSSSPVISYPNVLVTNYRAADCESAASFSALPIGKCVEGSKFSCGGDTVSMTVYSGSDCTGTSSTVTEAAGTCTTDDDDDVADDNSYSPGDGSLTMRATCSSGAASLANSLGAKAVLAIVLGAVAFLSM